MARRGTRRLEDFASFRTALSSLEAQALSSALRSCAPQVESSCLQLECQAVTSVLQSILAQVQSVEKDIHPSPQGKVDRQRDVEGGETAEQVEETYNSLREHLERCKSQVKTIEKRAPTVKAQLQSTISAYKAGNYAQSERKYRLKEALNCKNECINRVSEAAIQYQDKIAEIAFWRQEKVVLDGLLAVKVRKYEDSQAIWTNLGDTSELNAAQSRLESTKMTLEDLFARQFRLQEQISHKNAQLSALQLSKNAKNSDSLCQTARQTSLKQEIATVKSKIEQIRIKLRSSEADYASKRRITMTRMRDLERIHMEKADDLSNIASKRLQWTRTKASLERDYQSFLALAGRLNACIVQGNAKAKKLEKREDREWVQAQCTLLQEEFQGRRSTVAREVQSAYSLKTEN